MYARTTTIINPSGLHARPAAIFVGETKNYKSKITVKKVNDEESTPQNAKSIILLLAMVLKTGTEIEIAAEGEDEVLAVDNLIALVESGFGELDH